jgi:hypothetical protein
VKATTQTIDGSTAMREGIHHFTAERVLRLRRAVEKAVLPDGELLSGWSLMEDEPAQVLKAFPRLRLLPGFRLVGYRFVEGGNGNGIVYALPVDVAATPPEASPTQRDQRPAPPVPDRSLPNVMGAIGGDGTPASYLEASILARELAELGAQWHGCSWVTHHVLDADPFQEPSMGRGSRSENGFPEMTTSPDAWVWKTKRPERWAPAVEIGGDFVVVTLYTFSALGQEMLYRDHDKYRGGSYMARTYTKVLATGPGGFVF